MELLAETRPGRVTRLGKRLLALAGVCGLLLVWVGGFVVAVIPTPSMENAVLVGDHLLIEKLLYGPVVPFTKYRLPRLKQPQLGEVVSLRSLRNPDVILLKRVAAVAGDTVQLCGNSVSLVPRVAAYQLVTSARTMPTGSAVPAGCRVIDIRDDYIFLLGDNRDHSEDSRDWGPIPSANVIGAPVLVLWSYSAPYSAWLDEHGDLRPLVYLSALMHPSRTRWWRMGILF